MPVAPQIPLRLFLGEEAFSSYKYPNACSDEGYSPSFFLVLVTGVYLGADQSSLAGTLRVSAASALVSPMSSYRSRKIFELAYLPVSLDLFLALWNC